MEAMAMMMQETPSHNNVPPKILFNFMEAILSLLYFSISVFEKVSFVSSKAKAILSITAMNDVALSITAAAQIFPIISEGR